MGRLARKSDFRALALPFALGGAAALAATLALGLLAADDALRSTVVVLPVVVAALALLGAPWGCRPGRGELGVLAGLVALALARPHLGLRASEAVAAPVLAATLFSWVGFRAASLLRALRRRLGPRRVPRPPAALLLLPLLVYLALLPWATERRPPDGDEGYYLLQTHSLAWDFDRDLANNFAAGDSRRFMERRLAPHWSDPTGAGGERYSRHDVLLPLLLAPAYRIAGRSGAQVVMAALAAAVVWWTFRLGRRYHPGRPGELLAAVAMLAFAPPLLLYSHQIWVEVPAALLLLVALDGIWATAASPRQRRGLAQVALAVVLLPLLKLRFALLSLSILGLAAWRCRGARRRVGLLAAVLSLLGGALLIHNQVLYGQPLKDHSFAQLLAIQARPPAAYAAGLGGLLFDCAFGLFALAPVWILAVPAVALMARRRHPAAIDLAVLALPYLAVVVPRPEWYGAWSPPFRFGMVLLPLLALALVPMLAARRHGKLHWLLAAATALTLALTLLWTAVPGWTYHLADGSSQLLSALDGRLGADVTRFFPSFVRPRAATWLWPLGALAVLLLLRGRGRRRSAPAWGLTLALLGGALVAAAPARVPTRIVELEDRWVDKEGGDLHPERWREHRELYRGGWRLGPGDQVRVPAVTGGERVSVLLEVRLERGSRVRLELAADGRRPVSRLLDGRGWKTLRFDPLEWLDGDTLTLRLADSGAAVEARVVVDRMRLRWE